MGEASQQEQNIAKLFVTMKQMTKVYVFLLSTGYTVELNRK